MRFIFITALVVLCCWLFAERSNLTEKNAALTNQLDRSREKVSETEKKLTAVKEELSKLAQTKEESERIKALAEADRAKALSEAESAKALAEAERARADAASKKKPWLEGHIEKGARILDAPARSSNQTSSSR
jgi:uncharacterized membrane protein YqiK